MARESILSDGHSASSSVVHYAAFCTTARLQFRLRIRQPGCHGSQWSDRNVPIIKGISVLFLTGVERLFHTRLKQHKGDSELNAAISLLLPKDKKCTLLHNSAFICALNLNGKHGQCSSTTEVAASITISCISPIRGHLEGEW